MNTKRPLSLEGLMLISSLLAVALFLGLGAAMKNTPAPKADAHAEESEHQDDTHETESEEDHAATEDEHESDEPTEETDEHADETVQQPATNTATPDTHKSTNTPTNTAVQTPQPDSGDIEEEEDHIHVTFNITSPSGTKTYAFSAHAHSTVEEAMELAKDEGLTYTQKEYAGVGAYITTINGLSENKNAEMYWVYYINGARATAGISTQTLKEGDTVRWNYEKAF